MGRPCKYRTCRCCGEKKPRKQFRSTAPDCSECMEERSVRLTTGRALPDPFRNGVDVRGLDKFLRRSLP